MVCVVQLLRDLPFYRDVCIRAKAGNGIHHCSFATVGPIRPILREGRSYGKDDP